MKQTFKIKNHVEFNRKYIFGSLTGAVIGAGIGILFADKGSKPEKMKDGFDDVKNELKKIGSCLRRI
jgi:gas vesicle protein